MIRINTLGSATEINRYYIKGRDLEAYYSDNQEFNGYWGGKAAGMLGLEGYITETAFDRLANNLHPFTGQQLTARMRTDRRAGYDITFDVPKPVSVLWAYTQDDRLIRVMRETAQEMRDEMEKAAAARVRKQREKNTDENRITDNILTAEFVHVTARPEHGFPDPHLHIHLVVFNLTMDPVEKSGRPCKWEMFTGKPPITRRPIICDLRKNSEAWAW